MATHCRLRPIAQAAAGLTSRLAWLVEQSLEPRNMPRISASAFCRVALTAEKRDGRQQDAESAQGVTARLSADMLADLSKSCLSGKDVSSSPASYASPRNNQQETRALSGNPRSRCWTIPELGPMLGDDVCLEFGTKLSARIEDSIAQTLMTSSCVRMELQGRKRLKDSLM